MKYKEVTIKPDENGDYEIPDGALIVGMTMNTSNLDKAGKPFFYEYHALVPKIEDNNI